jgi:glucose-1-phosphate thymidylyltransferase
VYAFDGGIFDVLDETPRPEGDLDLPDAIGSIIESDEPIGAVRTRGIWIDATYPWDLLAVARDLLAAGWIDVEEADDAGVDVEGELSSIKESLREESDEDESGAE